MSDWKGHVAGGEDHTAKLRHRRNKVTTAAALKLGVFTAVSVMVTGLLTVIMGNLSLGSEQEYHAIFTNASMLQPGDDVRIAGVTVGEVKSVDHYERTMAEVTFKVDSDVQLTDSSTAEIRYLNLVGDRYMSLEEGGAGPDAKTLDAGATIDVHNTKPALDLTVLFDGFKPLFQALTPDQVNELSMNLVQVLQGEGGTVQSLLAHTASLTTSLADRDNLIGEVVDNLGETLKTVDQHHTQLTSLVVQLKNWMQHLAQDRQTIGGSLQHISDLTVTVADLLHRGRPLLKSDIAALHDLAKLLNEPKQRAAIEDLLKRMPEVMSDQLRTGTYGSWYQYYICAVNARIKLPIISGLDLPILDQISAAIENINFHSTAPRCQDK